MGVLSEFEPKSVFQFFEHICTIPHGSGNTAAISRYLVDFAKERGLLYRQDTQGNVIIWKDAGPGKEGSEPLMLQGHMDMVAVKKPGSPIDMSKDGLKLMVEGDSIFAKDTSLGGDDGIAVAYELALLDAKDIPHPPLECVFTVDEETGMKGAAAIDLSDCKATKMINIDSEDEGIFLAGCAGGMRVDCSLFWKRGKINGTACKIRIGGLIGGHSGMEIHKGRGNSNALMGRFLLYLSGKVSFYIMSIEGGLADNAIPRETVLELVVHDTDALKKLVQDYDEMLKKEYMTKDPGIFCSLDILESGKWWVVTKDESEKAAALLGCMPQGVQSYSAEVEGLVETSLNMGLLRGDENKLSLGFSLRSSHDGAKYAMKSQLEALTGSFGGSITMTGDYPGWVFKKDSSLRDKMSEIYTEMYGTRPQVEAVHAGLECGFFLGKKPELDCVSIGPNMNNIHTTEETMSISSVKRTWEFLCRVLQEV